MFAIARRKPGSYPVIAALLSVAGVSASPRPAAGLLPVSSRCEDSFAPVAPAAVPRHCLVGWLASRHFTPALPVSGRPAHGSRFFRSRGRFFFLRSRPSRSVQAARSGEKRYRPPRGSPVVTYLLISVTGSESPRNPLQIKPFFSLSVCGFTKKCLRIHESPFADSRISGYRLQIHESRKLKWTNATPLPMCP